MSTADHILDQIDTALHDHTVSPDAMRSTPQPPAPRPPAIVLNCDTRAAQQAMERLGRALGDFRRACEEATPGLARAAAQATAHTRAMHQAASRPAETPEP